ncbi:GNAT family N-acetyltransferase [Mucilaginibacter boryungensis]|uniref:N-acetyltransferase n=1 Tax=Mucilaginibacter boryungensis TaxID=768480 RepID=A0ABR9XIE0_9SPHI|nr:GNAT family N-acetyltransferase [Mucilaginibacter boryungensis]MBE9666849.1 N-acetyltransferase [Mucilaginibacter boryungensis]
MDYEAIELINNQALHKFELVVDGTRAFIDYKQKDDKVFLIHTEVPQVLQGKGVAAALVEKTFRYMEAHHLRLVPLCTYVKHFLTIHPEWNRLLVTNNEV